MLSRRGLHTVQTIGVPKGSAPVADAIVVALKSRMIEPDLAVAQSLAACRWFKKNGARHAIIDALEDVDLLHLGEAWAYVLIHASAPPEKFLRYKRSSEESRQGR